MEMVTHRKRTEAILVLKTKGRGKKKVKKIIRGFVSVDIDGDRKRDRITFWLRTGKGRNNKKGVKGSGYVANVKLSSQSKRKVRKRRKK